MTAFHKFCKSKKPIFFCDTETGSDWAVPIFKKAGIDFEVDKTRSFRTLLDDISYAEKNGFALIIDSVTHYWKELVEAYQKKLGVRRLSMHHWGPIKEEWGKFSTAYVNSKIHVAVCGRAGWEWGHEEDEEGHKELMKMGTKMKAEGEFGFEPSLLIEMERYRKSEVGSEVIHLAHILKDRRMDEKTLDGKTFQWKTGDPSDKVFKDLYPHIEWLNIGGKHVGVDTSDTSQDLFDSNGDTQWKRDRERKTIILEEINGLYSKYFSGTTAKEKKAKGDLAEIIFKTRSWTKVESMDINVLKNCYEKLTKILSDDKNIQILLGNKSGDIITNDPACQQSLEQKNIVKKEDQKTTEDIKIIRGIVANIENTNGINEKTQKPWIKYTIVLKNGDKFHTFSKSVADTAIKSEMESKEIEIKFTIGSGFGNMIKEATII